MRRRDGRAGDCPHCDGEVESLAQLPWAVVDALERVLEYLWADELKDFEMQSPDLAGEHIFQALCSLRWWLSVLPLDQEVSKEGDEQE